MSCIPVSIFCHVWRMLQEWCKPLQGFFCNSASHCFILIITVHFNFSTCLKKQKQHMVIFDAVACSKFNHTFRAMYNIICFLLLIVSHSLIIMFLRIHWVFIQVYNVLLPLLFYFKVTVCMFYLFMCVWRTGYLNFPKEMNKVCINLSLTGQRITEEAFWRREFLWDSCIGLQMMHRRI